MTWVPWVLTLLFGVAGGLGLWYYRGRYLAVQRNLDAADQVVAQWAAMFNEQAKRLADARAELETRQESERQDDQKKVAGASAGTVVDLLNGLHPRSKGPGPGSPTGV